MTTAIPDLIDKTHSKSAIWKFFGLNRNDPKGPAVCRLCAKNFTTRDDSTTSLWEHLKQKHIRELHNVPGLNGSLKRKRSVGNSTESSRLSKASRLEQSSVDISKVDLIRYDDSRWIEWSERLASFFYAGCSSLTEEDMTRIKSLCCLEGQQIYEFPSLSYFIDTTLHSLFDRTKDKVRQIVRAAEFACITLEYLSDTSTTLVTLHFISDNWECSDLLLAELDCTDTAVNGEVCDLLGQYGVDKEKIVAVVSSEPNFSADDLVVVRCFGSILKAALKIANKCKKMEDADINNFLDDRVCDTDKLSSAESEKSEIDALQILEDISVAVCDTDDTSAAYILPLLKTIAKKSSVASNFDDVAEIFTEMSEAYGKSNVEDVLDFATFVHPSFVQHSTVEFDLIRAELELIQPGENQPLKNGNRTIFDFMSPNKDTRCQSRDSRLRREYESYIKERPGPVLPLEWWKRKELMYPLLAKVARKYLTVAATCCNAYRIFAPNATSSCRHKHASFQVTSELTFLSAHRDIVL